MFKASSGIAITLCASFLAANPSGHEVMHGQADVQTFQNLLKITTGDKAIINWKEFSSALGEAIQFIQPSSSSAVLNRVTGGNTSTLYGQLQSNGQVYLVNPNGIVIGPHATIDAGAFIASTFDVLDRDFVEGSVLNFFGDSKAGVINLGTIKTSCGDAILIGFQAENDGSIDAAGKASLVTSNKVVLKLHDSQRIFIVSNKEISSGDTIDDPYSLVFNKTVEKEALHFKKDDTGIFLMSDAPVATAAGSIRAESVSILGDYVQVLEGTAIDASAPNGGGEILIGGDFQGKNDTLLNAKRTYVAKDTNLSADALENGDGGKIILWSDEWTGFYGRLSAQGGPLGGDGGLLEVSSPIGLDYRGRSNTAAPLGKGGSLLLDPSTITIDTFGGLGSSAPALPTPTAVYNPVVAAASIAVADLNNDLDAAGGSSIVISTSAGTVGTGDIIVNKLVTWGAVPGRTLTMNADRDILVNSVVGGGISSTGVGCDISLTAQRHVQLNGVVQNVAAAPGANVSVIANTGDINMPNNGGAGIGTAVCIATDFGTVLARATVGNITMLGGIGVASYASIGSTSSIVNPTRNATITVEAGGNITLDGGGAPNSKTTIGQTSSPGNIVTTTTTNINVTARGNISINGLAQIAGIGLLFQEPGLTNVTGDIRVNANGNVTLTSGAARSAIGIIAHIPGGDSIKSNLYLNVGGNLMVEQTFAGTGVNLGYNQDESTAAVLATSSNIFVAGNIWMDGRKISSCRLTGGYKGAATVPGYRPESFIHCLGNIILIGGVLGTGNEAIFDYSASVSTTKTDFTAHVWAAGAPQNVFDPNGGIRCINGSDNSLRANVLGLGGPTPNTSARSTGDIIVGSAVSFALFGTGSSAPYSAFNPQFSGLFIEADTCFATGELWPAQSATINGVNIFTGTLLGSPSPAFACDGLGAFAFDDNKYNTLLIPTPFTGVQTSVVPAVVNLIPAVCQFQSVSDVTIRSADKFLGELFRPTVGPVGVPNASFSANAPASITFGDAVTLNNIGITTLPINIEISGSGPIPAIGPSPEPPVHLCPCSNSFDTITINSSSGILTGIAPATGHIYLSANNNIIQMSGAGSDLSTSGLPATAFITLISDLNDSGAGSITLADNITTTAGAPIMLSAGINAGSGASGITQTAGQVSSGTGTITAQAVGNILIASTTDPAFISTTGNQSILSTTGSVTISQDVVTTTGSITVMANAGDISITPPAGALSGAVTSTSGPISLSAGGNVIVNGEASSVATTLSPITIFAGNSVLIDQSVTDTTEPVTITANAGNISINTSGIVSTTTGPMVLTAGNDINLNGLATTLLSTSGSISSTAGNNTNVTQNVATSGPITMISGLSMFLLTATTNISSSASPVILVVDNDFPSPPGIGPGLFSMVSGSQVNSGPGQSLQVFTARQAQNNISGALNGLNGFTFAAGTLFIDTATEHWCVYYPDPFFGGPGYTIFYKDCLQVIVPVANTVVSELLFDLNPANEWIDEFDILPEMWRFMLIYPPGVNALTDYDSEPYWISRRMLRLIHNPRVYKREKTLSKLVGSLLPKSPANE